MAKKEDANVFQCYLPNLRRFWIVKLPFVTLWLVAILQETSRLLSRRFLQDFAITESISEVWFKLLLTCVIYNVYE